MDFVRLGGSGGGAVICEWEKSGVGGVPGIGQGAGGWPGQSQAGHSRWLGAGWGMGCEQGCQGWCGC